MVEKIKIIRAAEKLTQKRLSEILKIPLKTVIGYEVGKRKPGVKFLLALCGEFPQYAFWIVTGKTESEKGHTSPKIQK